MLWRAGNILRLCSTLPHSIRAIGLARNPSDLEPAQALLLARLPLLPRRNRPVQPSQLRRGSRHLRRRRAAARKPAIRVVPQLPKRGQLLRRLLLDGTLLGTLGLEHGVEEVGLVVVERAELVLQPDRLFKSFLLGGFSPRDLTCQPARAETKTEPEDVNGMRGSHLCLPAASRKATCRSPAAWRARLSACGPPRVRARPGPKLRRARWGRRASRRIQSPTT